MRRLPPALYQRFWLLAALVACSGSLQAMTPAAGLPHAHRDTLSPAQKTDLPAVLLPGEESAVNESQESPAVLHQRSLLSVAETYGRRAYIPYVWGGNAVGDPATCGQCRACIEGRHHLRADRRPLACQACRQCGVDCSHFVNRVFHDAGLPYPYLATARMKRLSGAHLRSQYGLIDVGRDLRQARPGDLLVTRRHVILLLARGAGTVGDFIHVSRSITHGHVGGVELIRGQNLLRYGGRLVRILRHRSLESGTADLPLTPRATLSAAPRLVSVP